MDEFLYAFKKKKKVNPSCYWLATSNSGNITLDHMQVLMKKQGALQLVGYEHPTSTWTRGLLLTIDTMGVKQAKKSVVTLLRSQVTPVGCQDRLVQLSWNEN